MTLTFGSLFAGIEGFGLGFEQAGMRCAWQVEKDAAARSVLARHYPNVPRFDDVCTVGAQNLAPVDVICGGFPCQDLSVAGNRAGLTGARSGLFYEMTRITNELRPAYLVWENVPGLLSSGRGRDFAAVLLELERIGYCGCWTTLDAQFFGLAQRRQRIFGVFARRDIGAARCAEILALTTRLPWNTQARPEARANVAATIRSSSARSRGVNPGGRRGDDDVNLVVADTLTANYGKQIDSRDSNQGPPNLIAFAQNTRDEVRLQGGHGRIAGALGAQEGMKQRTYVAAYTVNFADSKGSRPDRPNGGLYVREVDQSDALTSGGNNTHLVFGGNDTTGARETATTLTAHPGGRYDFESENFVVAGALGSSQGGADDNSAQALHVVGVSTGVRRLTPTECERLQGFPDGWTEGQPDSTRYRQLGNAVAVPVARWIGSQLRMVF